MLVLFPLFFIVILIVLAIYKKKSFRFLRTRYFIILEILSIAWWLFLIIDQLRLKQTGCTTDDELCNSGNTFWGDIIWGSLLALLSLSVVWLIALAIGFISQQANKVQKPKKT